MKIMVIYNFFIFIISIILFGMQNIFNFELTKKNKELYLECIKLKQDTGNQNIQCEKILLENIKKDLKNKNNQEDLQSKREKGYEEDNKENKKQQESKTLKNQDIEDDQFDFDDYIGRIEKFIEGEINHLNKFKFFIGDFKIKSKQYSSIRKFIKSQNNNNVLNSISKEEIQSEGFSNSIIKNTSTDRINMKNSLRENLKKKENDENENEQNEDKRNIKFKQVKKNESNNDIDKNNLEKDFLKLREKFKLASEYTKDVSKNKSTKAETDEKEIIKKKNNIDLDSVQAFIKTLEKKVNNKDNKYKDKINSQIPRIEAIIKKEPKIELLNKLKNLGINFNNQDNEATRKLFKKFLDENIDESKYNKNEKNISQGNMDEDNRNLGEENQMRIKNMDDYKINDINESLSEFKNDIKGSNKNQKFRENKVIVKNNESKKEVESSINDFSEKLNLESLKNLIKNSSTPKKNIDKTQNNMDESNKSSNNKEGGSYIKGLKPNKEKDEKKESKKNDFNFSLGEIESQIEMLKNLSIKT